MGVLIAAAIAMAQMTQEVQRDFSIDLLLVGGNGPAITDWDWIDKPAQDSPIQGLLRTEIDNLQRSDCRYLIVDGGPASVFVPKSGTREIGFFYRDSRTMPMRSESWVTNGVTHVKNSDFRKINTGEWGAYSTSFSVGVGYRSQVSVYLDGPKYQQQFQLNDLTTIKTMLREGGKQMPGADGRVVLSEKSISDTIADLGAEADNGVALCEWGFPDAAHPNVVSCPPAGVIGHYKLYRKDGRLGLTLVDYIGSPALSF